MLSGKFLDVYLEITSRCNLKCIHCTFPHEPSAPIDMEMSTFERIAPEVLPHARSVIIYGGEPLIHRNFFSVQDGIQQYGIPFVGFITNGTLLNEHAADKLISAGIYRVIVSLDGATRVTYESVRTRAQFDEVLENIRTLHRQKALHHSATPRLGINFVVMRRNMAQMPQLVDLASALGADIINFAQLILHPCLGLESEALTGEDLTELYNATRRKTLKRAKRLGIAAFAPPEFPLPAGVRPPISERFTKALKSARDYARATWPILISRTPQSTHRIYDVAPRPENPVLCRTPWEIFEVQPNGDVNTCFCGRRGLVGNLLHQSFQEIWEGVEFRRLRNSLSGCSPLDETCEKCPDRSRNKPSATVFHSGIFGIDFWGRPPNPRLRIASRYIGSFAYTD
jgi:radical SAM protein with 4Fe4S-binding SPASM domain